MIIRAQVVLAAYVAGTNIIHKQQIGAVNVVNCFNIQRPHCCSRYQCDGQQNKALLQVIETICIQHIEKETPDFGYRL